MFKGRIARIQEIFSHFVYLLLFIIADRFIVLPQLLDDYLQQREAVPRTRFIEIDQREAEVKAMDILTAEVSVLKTNRHHSSH